MPKVTLLPSGKQFAAAAGQSILEAALAGDIALPYGCRTGSCGTCRGRILAGKVIYPDGIPIGLRKAEAAAGEALLCQACADGDVTIEAQEIAAIGEITVKTLPARIARMQRLSHDVMALFLKLPAVERLRFLAGQYVDILLPGHHRRSFSLANAPHEDELLELHIRHVAGGLFTPRVFNELKEKSLLRIQGPLGTFFWREDSSRPVLLIGGGTGFAPLKGILNHAFHSGVTRPLHLYWGVRARRDLYQPAVPETWACAHENFAFTPVLSEPSSGDDWAGRTGWVHETVLHDYPDLSSYDVYISGPPPMVDAARRAFFAAGLPKEHLFYDSFEFAPEVRRAMEEEE